MTTTTLSRKELQATLKEIREDWDIDINLRASTDKLQEIYEYWIESGRISIKREVKRLHKNRVYFMKNTERRLEIEAKIDQLWAQYDALETTEAPQANETPNEVPQDTLNEVPQDIIETTSEPTKATLNPLPTDVYEATREKLINRWDKLGQRLGQEKADKYRYTQACKIQGVEPDTTSFDETIAEYRQYIKNINQQINDLDIAQGLEPDED